MPQRHLSKSRLLSARQCVKRLYLELHRPELAVVTADMRQALEHGHAVGAVAQSIYGSVDAVVIPYAENLDRAVRETATLVRAGPAFPIFEATFEFEGVLVRVDALLPSGEAWRIVEVKASTRVEPHHEFDCAVQSWVFRNAGHRLSGIALAHVDNQFVYTGGGNYNGLLQERDLTDAVDRLLPAVPDWVRVARDVAAGQEPDIAVGGHCFKPYACPFASHCWPGDVEFPILDLPRANKGKLGEYVSLGYRDIRDIPTDLLTEAQRRVQRVCIAGRAEVDSRMGRFMRALDYPRYYLDFESVGPPVPRWPGIRPYQALPFQWSCHYEGAPGDLSHADFLDLSGVAPFRRLAESLLRVVGRHGPIIVYSQYERVMIGRLAALFPDLGSALAGIAERLVDVKPVIEANFYHPAMHGSWSLKAVLPVIAPDMQYSELEEIQEGTAASSGYLEAIDPATEPGRKAGIERELLRYCEFDTLAMVRLVRYFAET